MARLKATNLSFAFGFEEILKNINFEINQGETLSIVGPSGAGKTTLLRLCAGLIDMDEGEVENTFATSAFAFQDARLLPWKTCLDNISLGLRARGVKNSREKAKQIGLDFGLDLEDLDKFPKDLSGGMRQRASFARALILEPEILFLDEPFSALDIGLKKDLQTYILSTIKRTNMSVFFITHDLTEALRLSDKILVLKTEPGEIVREFSLKKSKLERDDAFVYKKMLELLADELVREVFELEQI